MFGDFSVCIYLERSIEGVGVREVAVSVGVGSAATVAVVCDVKVYDWVAWTGCVAKVPYYFEIPPFFPFTRGYLILSLDGMACRAEDRRAS